MPICNTCKEFVSRRKTILQKITNLPYDKETKELIYYDDKLTDPEFEDGLKVCKECFNEVCDQSKQDCEDINNFVTTQAPLEQKNRQKRRELLSERVEKAKEFFTSIQDEPSCKKCSYFGNKRSNLIKLSDNELEQENLECGNCVDLCEKKGVNTYEQKNKDGMYCRRTKAQKEVSDKDKDKRRLLNLEKLYNVQKVQRELKK
jgi:hypothetical protein